MGKKVVDWNEASLTRWLGTVTKGGTKAVYKSAFRAYSTFTGLTATQMIDEAIEDSRLDIRERKDIVKTRIVQFYHWLANEYPVYSRGKGESKLLRKGVRSKTAHCWVNGIRSFYGTFEIFLKLKGRSSLPPARVVNKRLDLTTMDVKALVDHVRSPRDRAMILTMFQSGMDVSTLCLLKREVIKEFDEHPLKIELFREKTGTEYYSFLGRDAIDSIKAYLNDLKSRGITLKPRDSLFIKETKKNGELQPMETNLVQKVLREGAVRSELVTEDMNGHDQNPASPHALREAFGSIMTNKGVPDSIADFWLGHAIGEMAEAYKRQRFEEVKRMYSERERYISIVTPESDAIEEIRKEATEKTGQLRENFDSLYSETMALKKTIKELKQIVKGQGESDEQLKKVVAVLMKAPLGAIPNVKPAIDVKKLSDKEFKKLMKKEQEKYDKEYEEAMRIIAEWS